MSKSVIKQLEARIEKLESIVTDLNLREGPISAKYKPIKRSFKYYLAFEGKCTKSFRSIFTAEVFFATSLDDFSKFTDLDIIEENEVNYTILQKINEFHNTISIFDHLAHLSDKESIFNTIDLKIRVELHENGIDVDVKDYNQELV